MDGPQWRQLVAAVQHAAIYVAIGFSESDDDKLYMSQALMSPEGDVLIHRRKLRPSGGERTIWSDGNVGGLEVVDTPYGRMGMLECWE
jgi:predicted amidohydrolase